MAAHLRSAFAGDGEEVAEVIARHHLDALHAIPEDPDAAQIRAAAITALVRAGERAERTGAPALAAASYATAAELTPPDSADGQEAAALLWERAARAATTNADWVTAVEHAGRARDLYRERGQDRPAARAQAIAGRALNLWGRYAEARDQLTAAVEVLRADPDTDTVRALAELAALESFAGSPDADRLTAEALVLLDHAEYLTRHGHGAAAASAIDEARGIGRRLRCQPLLDRADALERAQPLTHT